MSGRRERNIRKQGRKDGRTTKEGRKERNVRKEGRKEGILGRKDVRKERRKERNVRKEGEKCQEGGKRMLESKEGRTDDEGRKEGRKEGKEGKEC